MEMLYSIVCDCTLSMHSKFVSTRGSGDMPPGNFKKYMYTLRLHLRAFFATKYVLIDSIAVCVLMFASA